MMEKKPTGAPRGNQNARRHGFYSRVLDEARKLQLDQARDVEGIDEEISSVILPTCFWKWTSRRTSTRISIPSYSRKIIIQYVVRP